MKKIFVFLIVGIVFLMVSGVFAASPSLPEDVDKFVKKIVQRKGIDIKDIKDVRKVDFDKLPKQIDFKNIDDTNLALYEIDTGEGEPVFVLTVSDEKFRSTVDYKRSFLNFGFGGQMRESGFLETATGVETSLEKGYVMVRGGSITGISTNLEVVNGTESGQIEIIIYKNGMAIGFGNTLNAFSSGVEIDHDIQSEGTIEFESGDVISVYAKAQGDIVWEDVITMIEITTLD